MKVILFHAGCPVCVSAIDLFGDALFTPGVLPDVVHLGGNPSRVAEAEAFGVKTVPALVNVYDDGSSKVYHINFGANLADLPRE